MELDIVLLWRLGLVVEDVVESDIVLGHENVPLDLLIRLLQVSSANHHLLHLFVGEGETAHGGAAIVVRVGNVLYHEGVVVQNGAGSQSLNDEVFVLLALVVKSGQLHHARLNHNHAVNGFPLTEDVVSLVVRATLHVVDQLLLCDHRQVAEVIDFVQLHLQKGLQVILVLEAVLLESLDHVRELALQHIEPSQLQ